MRLTTCLAALSLASTSLAQPISPVNKFAWGENVGFLNWHDAPAPDAPFVDATHLSGFVWGENIGWINLGDGNGPYANTSALNFGVNRNPSTGHLTGYAWSENTGWINFAGGSLASPPNPARIEGSRLRGYAWGENIGWINLDDDTHFVALACPADLNADGVLNVDDIQLFITAFVAADPLVDLSGPFGVPDGVVNIDDVQAFVTSFLAGCP